MNVDDDNRLTYTHQLKKGVSSIEHYGITLARATGFPGDILKAAQDILSEVSQSLKVKCLKIIYFHPLFVLCCSHIK